MHLDKLPQKSLEEFRYYAQTLHSRNFDGRDVELFLIHGRFPAFEPTLFEFANSIAHARRDRGLIYKASKKAEELDAKTWRDDENPLGSIGYSIDSINKQLNSVMYELKLDEISNFIANDFAACLCVIGNHIEYLDKNERVLGTTSAIVVNGTISLDLTPVDGCGNITLMKAETDTPFNLTKDCAEHQIHAVRATFDKPLKLCFKTSPIKIRSSGYA